MSLHVSADLNLGYQTVSDGTRGIALSDVLMFWTGANSIPPTGFPVPAIIDDSQPTDKPLSVDFCRVDDGRLPYSSTCGLTLWLPLGCELEEFERRLTTAFRDCRGFGKVWYINLLKTPAVSEVEVQGGDIATVWLRFLLPKSTRFLDTAVVMLPKMSINIFERCLVPWLS